MTLRTAITQRSIGFLGTAFLGVVVCAFFLTGAAALAPNDAAPSLMVPLLPILCIVLGAAGAALAITSALFFVLELRPRLILKPYKDSP